MRPVTLTRTFMLHGQMFQAIVRRSEVDIDWDEQGNPCEWLWDWELNTMSLPRMKIDEGRAISRAESVRHAEGGARLYVESSRVLSL